MNDSDDRWPDGARDRELSRLMADAVCDLEPADRLAEVRARTVARRRRSRLLVTGGAMVAAAAVVTAVALAGGNQVPSTDPGPAAPGPNPTSPSPTATEPSPSATTSDAGRAIAVYYLNDTPRGVRLYREFHSRPGDPLQGAVDLLSSPPGDPDYRTGWTAGQILGASFDGVGSAGEVALEVDPAATARPEGMDDEEAAAAVQQVVYTMQAAVRSRASVRFVADGEPVASVLGLAVPDPVANGSPLDTLALVNLTAPEEGTSVTTGTLAVEGVANSFEANVPWTLLSEGEPVAEDFFTAEGWMGDRLFPFSGEIDVSSLEPGSYTLKVETDDPAAGAEGSGPTTDTRTVVIE